MIFFIPLLIFALEPTLIRTYSRTSDPLTISSLDGNYKGRIDYGDGNTEFIPIDHFILEDSNGDLVYEKHAFGHTLLDIANTGIVVGIDFDGPVSGRATIHFYDRNGEETQSHEIGFLQDRVFSENGEIYCVNDGINGLTVFDGNGKKLYAVDRANYIAVSRNGRMIAAASDDGIDIYEDGQLVSTIPLMTPFVREMVFSDDGSHLLYIDRRNVRYLDVRTGEMVRQYREQNKHLSFISCDISPDGSLIIAGLDEDMGRNAANRHSRGVIHLISAEGKVVWSEELPYTQWNSSIPNVSFTNAMSFTIETIDDVLEFAY